MLIYVDFIVLIALIDCFESFAFLPHRLWRIAWAFWAVFLLPFYCPFYCLFIGVARAVAFAFSFYLAVMVFYFSFQPAKKIRSCVKEGKKVENCLKLGRNGVKNEDFLHFVVKIFGHVTKKKYFCAENNIFVIYKIVKLE